MFYTVTCCLPYFTHTFHLRSGYLWCFLTFHLANLEHIPSMEDGAMDRNKHETGSPMGQKDLLYENKAEKGRVAYKDFSGGWGMANVLGRILRSRVWWEISRECSSGKTYREWGKLKRRGKGLSGMLSPIQFNLVLTHSWLGSINWTADLLALRWSVEPFVNSHQVILCYEMFWRVGGISFSGRWLPRRGSCEHQWSRLLHLEMGAEAWWRAAGWGTDGVSYTCLSTREAVWLEECWQSYAISLAVSRNQFGFGVEIDTWSGQRWTAGV